MGYLIGEKFLYYLEAAETNAEWRKAIPEFVAQIKTLFEPWKVSQFLATPRRLAHSAMSPARRCTRCFGTPWTNPRGFKKTPGT